MSVPARAPVGERGPGLLIVGCGYVGLALSRTLSTEGWRVWGLRRNPEAYRELEAAGAEPVLADLTQPKTLHALPAAEYVVACQGAGRQGDPRRTYVEGTANLLTALAITPPTRYLFISSTSVYGECGGAWVDETTPPKPITDETRIWLEAESLVLAAPFPSMVLRLAGIYGPGRDRLRLIREGIAPIEAGEYLNQIHVDDIVGMLRCLLERGQAGEVYLGADDEPVQKSVFYRWLAQQAGVPLRQDPVLGAVPPSHHPGNRRCRNAKIKALGYTFKYPNYRVGFANLLSLRPKPGARGNG